MALYNQQDEGKDHLLSNLFSEWYPFVQIKIMGIKLILEFLFSSFLITDKAKSKKVMQFALAIVAHRILIYKP